MSANAPTDGAPIAGHPGYLVTRDGHVWSEKTSRYLSESWPKRGTTRVTLWQDSKQSSLSLAALVLCTFLGPRPKGHVAKHRNGDKTDCSLGNLEWAKPTQESQRKLDPDKAALARNLIEDGVSLSRIAESLGVSRVLIWLIANGRAWKEDAAEAMTEAAE